MKKTVRAGSPKPNVSVKHRRTNAAPPQGSGASHCRIILHLVDEVGGVRGATAACLRYCHSLRFASLVLALLCLACHQPWVEWRVVDSRFELASYHGDTYRMLDDHLLEMYVLVGSEMYITQSVWLELRSQSQERIVYDLSSVHLSDSGSTKGVSSLAVNDKLISDGSGFVLEPGDTVLVRIVFSDKEFDGVPQRMNLDLGVVYTEWRADSIVIRTVGLELVRGEAMPRREWPWD